MKSLLRIFLGSMLLTACHTSSLPVPEPLPQATPTETGQPVGNPSQKTLGPAGGSIISPDNVLTITIPAGALTSETLIQLQPVENKAFGGTGLGYQISPQNLKLAKPASLEWTFSNTDLQGSAPEALAIAIQQPDRTWQGRRNVRIDKVKQKASTSFDKLLTFALYEQYYMAPQQETIAPGEAVPLAVFFQSGREASSDTNLLEPLSPHVRLSTDEVKNWRVNNRDLINQIDPELGSMSLTKEGASAIYTAPARIPKKNAVAVSVEVILKKTKAKLLLVSNFVIQSDNEFMLNGKKVDSASVLSIGLANQFFHIGLSEGRPPQIKQALLSLSIPFFTGTGQYTVDDLHAHISGQDQTGKSWSDSYSDGKGHILYGPLSVKITEYDAARKRVSGQFSGTMHHVNSKTHEHEKGSVSARFQAASPY